MIKIKGIISLALVVILCATTPGITSYATDIDDANDKISDLENEADDIQETIDELESAKSDINTYISEVDADLSEISNSIYEIEQEYDEVEEKLEETQEQLEEAQESIDEQYASMKLRIQFMYENGDTEYINMLFGSESISDFLNSIEYVSELTEYDRQMLVKMQETKELIETSEKELLDYQDELETLLAEKTSEQEELEALLNEKENELANYEAQIASAEESLDEIDEEIEAQEEVLQKLEEAESKRQAEEESSRKAAEEASRQAAQNSTQSTTASSSSSGSSQTSSSGFIWPCPSSHTVSSSFGYRQSPTAGASSYHQGIDISASYGSTIVAAASGTVEWACYSSSAGYWIGIYHGNGTYTVYMHCSSLLVSEGASVSQGQTIALVGSTGYSTGNHLHFGVRINGAYVNPLNYVS